MVADDLPCGALENVRNCRAPSDRAEQRMLKSPLRQRVPACPSPSVSVMKKERRPGGRHAGEPHRRVAFEDPGSGPWRTDVIAFVGLPLLLLGSSWIAVAAFRAGGVDRWNGLAALCLAASLVIPAALRWRGLRTEAATRSLRRLYIVLGLVALVGVVVGLT